MKMEKLEVEINLLKEQKKEGMSPLYELQKYLYPFQEDS